MYSFDYGRGHHWVHIGTFSESFNVAVLVRPLLSLLLSVPVLVALYRRDGMARR